MKILVLEDERNNFLRLQKQLKTLSEEYEIVGPADTVSSAREYLREGSFDLIIADIHLTDGLVFDAFDDSEIKCAVIFTTAYDEYALKAFRYNGIAYLLKPIILEELEEAIAKVRSLHPDYVRENLGKLYSLLRKGNLQYRQRFLVADRDGYMAIPVDAVSHICSEGGLTRLFLKDKHSHVIDMSLDELEEQLAPTSFIRANRQYIIHIGSVKRLNNWFNRKMKVLITEYPDKEVIVSKEKTTSLKQWLDS